MLQAADDCRARWKKAIETQCQADGVAFKSRFDVFLTEFIGEANNEKGIKGVAQVYKAMRSVVMHIAHPSACLLTLVVPQMQGCLAVPRRDYWTLSGSIVFNLHIDVCISE